MAVVTYWCQGKYKCQFRTSDIEAAATFKSFFIPEFFDVQGVDSALKICEKHGGNLAVLKNEQDIQLLKDTFSTKKKRLEKAERFWVHQLSPQYLTDTKYSTHIDPDDKGICVSMHYSSSETFDFTVGSSFR